MRVTCKTTEHVSSGRGPPGWKHCEPPPSQTQPKPSRPTAPRPGWLALLPPAAGRWHQTGSRRPFRTTAPVGTPRHPAPNWPPVYEKSEVREWTFPRLLRCQERNGNMRKARLITPANTAHHVDAVMTCVSLTMSKLSLRDVEEIPLHTELQQSRFSLLY